MGQTINGQYYPDATDAMRALQGGDPKYADYLFTLVASGKPVTYAGGATAGGGGAAVGGYGVPVSALQGLGFDTNLLSGMADKYGLVGTDVLKAAYDYLTFGPIQKQQMALAQLAESGATQRAGISAGASLAGAQAQAQATMGAAQAQAQATIQAQQIQTEGQLRAVRAQIMGDLQRALMGEQGASMRLQAELIYAAQLENQKMRLQVAQLAASSGLRDAAQARFFTRGMGDQPAIGSAFLAGPLQEIVAPGVGAPSMPDTSFLNSLPGGTVSGQSGGGTMDYAQRVKSAGFARGTPGAGVGYLVGERGPEVLRLGPKGVEVIPLVGGRQGGGAIPDYRRYPETGFPGVLGGGYYGYDVTGPAWGETLTPASRTAPPDFYMPGVSSSPTIGGGPGTAFGYPAQVKPGGAGGVFTGGPINAPLGYKETGEPILPGEYYDYSVGQWKWGEPSAQELLQAGLAQQGTAFGQPAGGILVPQIASGAMGQAQPWAMPEGGWPEPLPPVPAPPPVIERGSPIPPSVTTPAGRTGGIGTAGGLPPEPTAGGAGGGTPLDTTGILSDLANLPAFQMARTGKVWPAFQNMSEPVDLGFGLGTLPWPAQWAGIWRQLSPQDQQDLLDAASIAGIPPEMALYQLMRASPGYRVNVPQTYRVF